MGLPAIGAARQAMPALVHAVVVASAEQHQVRQAKYARATRTVKDTPVLALLGWDPEAAEPPLERSPSPQE